MKCYVPTQFYLKLLCTVALDPINNKYTTIYKEQAMCKYRMITYIQ